MGRENWRNSGWWNTYIDVYYDYGSIQEKLEEYNSKILDYISNELSKESEENKRGYLNGSLCLQLSEDLLFFKDGNQIAIRDMNEYYTCECDESCIAEELLNMGLLEKVCQRIDSLEKNTLNETIKFWYEKTYPSHSIARTLSDKVTFHDLNDCLSNGEDVYELLGGNADSIIRERCFEKLAELTGQDYDVIYNKWMYGDQENTKNEIYQL